MRQFLASLFLLGAALLARPAIAQTCSGPAAICPGLGGVLPVIDKGRPLPVLIDGKIGPGAILAAQNLEKDLWRVAGHKEPPIAAVDRIGPMIIIGTVGKSPII